MKKISAILSFILIVSTSCASSYGGYKSETTYNKKEHKHEYKHLAKNDSGKHKEKKKKALPPGLKKKVASGKSLPPGWQKKIRKGEVLDQDVYINSVPLDFAKFPHIPHGNPLTEVIRVHDKILRIMKDSHEVLEILK